METDEQVIFGRILSDIERKALANYMLGKRLYEEAKDRLDRECELFEAV